MHFLPKVFWDPQISEYVRQVLSQSVLLSKQKPVMHFFLHKVFPGILQVIIPNGMVLHNATVYGDRTTVAVGPLSFTLF